MKDEVAPIIISYILSTIAEDVAWRVPDKFEMKISTKLLEIHSVHRCPFTLASPLSTGAPHSPQPLLEESNSQIKAMLLLDIYVITIVWKAVQGHVSLAETYYSMSTAWILIGSGKILCLL